MYPSITLPPIDIGVTEVDVVDVVDVTSTGSGLDPPQAVNMVINKDCIMIFVNKVREVFLNKIIIL